MKVERPLRGRSTFISRQIRGGQGFHPYTPS